MTTEIEGQLNARERELLGRAILDANPRPKIVLEVGTWLGGGSTVHFLRALEKNGEGHLYGIECDRSIYEQLPRKPSIDSHHYSVFRSRCCRSGLVSRGRGFKSTSLFSTAEIIRWSSLRSSG